MNLRTVVLVVIILVLHAPGDNSWNRRRRRHSRKPPPCHQRPCQVSEWSAWSGCSDGCVQTRRRYKTMSESCGGGCHFRLYEKRACTDHENCQPSCQKRPCLVSEWSPWSVCSGGCSQKRHRHKTLSESCGGVCNFHLYEERACHGNCQKDSKKSSNTENKQSNDEGLGTGGLVGVIVAVFVALCGAGGGISFCVRKYNSKRNSVGSVVVFINGPNAKVMVDHEQPREPDSQELQRLEFAKPTK